MGESAVTRLLGIDWSDSGEAITVYRCGTDVLPMTLDWMAAGVPARFIGSAHDLLGHTVREVSKSGTPPYLHPDGTSILTAKPDHPATVEHLNAHGFRPTLVIPEEFDLGMWHSMAHSEPRIETAITAAIQLGADWRHLTITGFEERFKDLLDLLGETKEENDRLRGIIQATIDYHREEEG